MDIALYYIKFAYHKRLINYIEFRPFGWWLKYGYRFPEFLQTYVSSRAKTKQAVYTDMLVTKSVKISAGRALLFAKAINEQTPNFSFCIFHRSWQSIYSPTKFLKNWNYLQYQRISCTESFYDQKLITDVQFSKQYRLNFTVFSTSPLVA